ncbi:MAG: hypothetical protein LBB17_00330, partial [Puniceicoccales bacterium]|nr:hypothetical protein [Puniceicoccales bacterium]
MTEELRSRDEQGIVPGAGSGQNARSPSVQQRRENFPRHTSAVSGEVLGGRDATRVDYRDQMDANKETQTKLQNEIGKISQEIAELGSAHMPTKKISMFALMATVAIGGIVAVTASIFAAPLTCCIVVGALVGVLVGAATAITLHRRNCHLQEQGKLLERVRSANTGLSIASAALD